MRLCTLLLFFMMSFLSVWGQSPEIYLYKEPLKLGSKPAIDFAAIEGFGKQLAAVDIYQSAISRDGRYCSYGVNQGLMLQSTENDWRYWLASVRKGFFAGNNRRYVYQVKDSLIFLPLGGGNAEIITMVSSYQLFEQEGRNEWVAVHLQDQSCILKNLLTGKEQRYKDVSAVSFSNNDWFGCLRKSGELAVVRLSTWKVSHYRHVTDYSFDGTDRVLILKTLDGERRGLQWADPLSGKVRQVWEGRDKVVEVGGYSIDDACRRLAFMVQYKQEGKFERAIWYYEKDMKEAVLKVDRQSTGIETGFELSGVPSFSSDGRYILFSLKKGLLPKAKPRADAVQLDVWHYQDTFLMSAQVAQEKHPEVKRWLSEVSYSAVMAVQEGRRVFRLTEEHERLGASSGDYAVVVRNVITGRLWESASEYSLVSLQDGRHIALKKEIGGPCVFLSKQGNKLFCWDTERAQYMSYDIATGKYTNLSEVIPEWLGQESEFCDRGVCRDPSSPEAILWLEGQASVLVYDYYDIWELDLTGKKPAVNITGGYGRKHRIRFDVVREAGIMSSNNVIRRDARLLLLAVNMDTKENGFYTVQLGKQAVEPEKLFMGPYLQHAGRAKYGYARNGTIPVKARDAWVWLVSRKSSTDPLNLYVTRDLRAFRKLTEVKPLEGYNWLQSELVNFTQQDGSVGKGLLYRPEDFDSRKKYPVLIYYYRQNSLWVNEFLLPGYTSDAHINIPWFVSRGYIVFVPDIYFTKKISGASALNAVEGAADWLGRQSYIDSTKMGIAGHSFAGGMTNYILTHTNRFAAVFEGAGGSDWVSAALQLSWDDGWPRMVGTGDVANSDRIWKEQDIYRENPIMHVDKVTSPVLMFHCRKDAAVAFEQGVELFTALWRLGKKAWMLQYDEGSHAVRKQKDMRDLTVRVTQFFDHYLKGAPAPLWMTRGIRGELKGIETGLELDSSDRQP